MAERILIVEDDPTLRRVLCDNLVFLRYVEVDGVGVTRRVDDQCRLAERLAGLDHPWHGRVDHSATPRISYAGAAPTGAADGDLAGLLGEPDRALGPDAGAEALARQAWRSRATSTAPTTASRPTS